MLACCVGIASSSTSFVSKVQNLELWKSSPVLGKNEKKKPCAWRDQRAPCTRFMCVLSNATCKALTWVWPDVALLMVSDYTHMVVWEVAQVRWWLLARVEQVLVKSTRDILVCKVVESWMVSDEWIDLHVKERKNASSSIGLMFGGRCGDRWSGGQMLTEMNEWMKLVCLAWLVGVSWLASHDNTYVMPCRCDHIILQPHTYTQPKPYQTPKPNLGFHLYWWGQTRTKTAFFRILKKRNLYIVYIH